MEALYRELLLKHNRAPIYRGRLAQPTAQCVGENPLCGDRLALDLRVQDGTVAEVGYEVEASALTVAMASMVAELVRGQPVARALELTQAIRAAFEGSGALPPDCADIALLLPLQHYPNRRKSLTLAPATFAAALQQRPAVTTEN